MPEGDCVWKGAISAGRFWVRRHTRVDNSVGSKLNRPALEAGGGIQLRSVDGGLLNNLSRVCVAIKVGHAIIEQEAHVIGKLPNDLLLGIDFIRSSRMVLNAAEGYVQWAVGTYH